VTSFEGHRAKTELAVHVLRERIRTGELPPSARLRLETLKAQLGMSPTPVREALRLLQADGLVQHRPHQGIVVAELSPTEVGDLARLRMVLEPLAIELALPHLGEPELGSLERLHERYLRAVAGERGTAINAANAAWHWAIYEASGSPLLNEFVRRLWETYPWRTMWAVPGRTETSAAQHEQVMEALRCGDGAAAAGAMRVHIDSGTGTLLARLDGDPKEHDGGRNGER
jgi:DNA-binding GntR family transcriptional regulator